MKIITLIPRHFEALPILDVFRGMNSNEGSPVLKKKIEVFITFFCRI
jgi:hypothetical protein